jgi:hypothetical protein
LGGGDGDQINPPDNAVVDPRNCRDQGAADAKVSPSVFDQFLNGTQRFDVRGSDVRPCVC